MTKKICNMCGKEFDIWDTQEGFGIFAGDIGYGSKFDGESVIVDLCCSCFDRLVESLNKQCVHPFLEQKED